MEFLIAILGGLFAGGILLVWFAFRNSRATAAYPNGRTPVIVNVVLLPSSVEPVPASRRIRLEA